MLKDGFFTIKDNKIIGGEFTIDMNSIVDLDLDTNGKWNKKLVNHLKSEDFFDTATFPTAKFIISAIEPKNDKFIIKGLLTLKDKTNPVEFIAKINNTNNSIEFISDTFKIDRSKWNVKHKSKSFFDLKDNFIYDDIEIKVIINTIKSPK